MQEWGAQEHSSHCGCWMKAIMEFHPTEHKWLQLLFQRHWCCEKQNQNVCSAKGHTSKRSAQNHHPRWSRQVHCYFSRPQQLGEMFPIYPAVLDSMRCFEQAIRNDLRGNKCVLNGTFTRFLILSCDRGFKGNAQYQGETLWGSAQCNLTIFQFTGWLFLWKESSLHRHLISLGKNRTLFSSCI